MLRIVSAIGKVAIGWSCLYYILKLSLGIPRYYGVAGLAQIMAEAILTTICVLAALVVLWWALWPKELSLLSGKEGEK